VKKKIFLYSPELEHGGYPPQCPFDSSRPGRTRQTIVSMGLLSKPDRAEVAPQRADRATLTRFHDPAYLDLLAAAGHGRIAPLEALKAGLGTPDCPIFPNMLEYLALAAGASVAGARRILDGEAAIAFNPAGGFHHAQPAHAAGFCYLNDIVLAALEFTAAKRRVLFLDLDVHHCDGVQEAFYARSDVMTISLHESGRTLFPGTGFVEEIGVGAGRGYSVNIPLPVGTYDEAYERAFRQAAWPLMQAYDPDVVILELGMDGLAGDPLAHLQLTNNVYANIVERVVQMGKPVLATGGGGYNVPNTVRGWALMWGVLCGEDCSSDLIVGMGGVMLQNTEWLGGLRDRVLLTDGGRRGAVDDEIEQVVERLRKTVFPIHGL